MKVLIRQFMALAGLTALETLRQPVFLLISTTSLVFIALLPLLITHTLGEARNMVLDSALALHFVCGVVLGSLAASATLSREIRRGTAATILCKPVNRGVFFLAKFSGIAAVMLLFSTAACMATILSDRVASNEYETDWWALAPLLAAPLLAYAAAGIMNYLTRRPFSSAAFSWLAALVTGAFLFGAWVGPGGQTSSFGLNYAWKILPASLLVTMAILILAGIAVSLATRLDMIPNLSVCSLLFLLGLMSDYLLGRHAATSLLARLGYTLIPNLQHFWVSDALHGGEAIPWHYVLQAGLYSASYLAAMLMMGALMFRNMEVKA
ncbi:MAG: ABC transporter permease subunit [Lentisphaerota bacterium]